MRSDTGTEVTETFAEVEGTGVCNRFALVFEGFRLARDPKTWPVCKSLDIDRPWGHGGEATATGGWEVGITFEGDVGIVVPQDLRVAARLAFCIAAVCGTYFLSTHNIKHLTRHRPHAEQR